MRLLAFGLLAALTACAPEIDLSADAALEAASLAAEAGDTKRAVALLDHAAETGDLDALAHRDEVFEQGYILVAGTDGGGMRNRVSVPVWFWQQRGAAADLEVALERGVQAGDPSALLIVAQRQAWSDARYGSPARQTNLDSARTIYHQIRDADLDPMRLASLAHTLADSVGWRRHLEDGTRAGDPTACLLLYFRDHNRRIATARGTSDAIDYHEECRDRALESGRVVEGVYTDDMLQSLMTQVRIGNDLAAAHRDSLLALGVGDRHPRLQPVLEDDDA